SGQKQQPDRGCGVDVAAFVLVLTQSLSDSGEPVDPEKALAPVVPEQNDARHRVVGPKAPGHCEGHDRTKSRHASRRGSLAALDQGSSLLLRLDVGSGPAGGDILLELL